MAQKTLGIIGKGGVVSHFFENLSSYTSRDRSSECTIDDFFSEIRNVVFYEHRAGAFDDFCARKQARDNTKTMGNCLDDLQKFYSFSYTAEGSFKTFFDQSNIIVEAAGGWASPIKDELGRWVTPKDKDYSVMRYACELWEKRGEKIKLSEEKDCQIYLDTQKSKSKVVGDEKKFKEKFKEQWEISLQVLETVSEIHHRGYLLGERSFLVLPFAVQMMVERAKEISGLTYNSPLPTYIMVTNEPCVMSGIVSGICPKMTPYLVALTGFDTIRLEEILNKDYSGLKKKAGLENIFLQLSLRGFHDTYGMVPWIYPQKKEDRGYFDKLVHSVDFEAFYTSLKKDVQEYHGRVKQEGGDPNVSVDKALLSTIVNAARSCGKALSVYPMYGERALCNGYYHADVLGTGKRMFFVGQHRFRNGKVIANDTC